MFFRDIPGVEETKQSLLNAVANDHVAHAQLFVGKPGSANLAMALAFTRYLNCENRQETDGCGECPSCSKINKWAHPDITFVYPTASTPQIKESLSVNFLELWRSFLAESPYRIVQDWAIHSGAENKQLSISVEESRNLIKNISLKAFESRYKVIIIWLPETMNPSAANSLLKVLEEPPSNTMFFLVADNTDKMLVTILSRCQAVKIRSFHDEEIVAHLNEKYQTLEDKGQEIARLAEGNLNKAIALSGSLSDKQANQFKVWMRNCWRFNALELVNQASEFQKQNKDSQKGLFQTGLSLIRETIVASAGATDISKVLPEDTDFVNNFSKTLTTAQLGKISEKLNDAFYHLERNVNPQMVYLDTSFDIYKILKLK